MSNDTFESLLPQAAFLPPMELHTRAWALWGKHMHAYGANPTDHKADIQAAAGVGAGLTPSQLIGYGWWKITD